MVNPTADVGFAVYVHWPFCVAKCPYCDFNSHVRSRPMDQQRYSLALVRELEHFAALTPDRTVSSVFFGGGTPSLMTPDSVERVLTAVRRLWRLSDTAEITMEANPDSADVGRFAEYRALGVNRVSVGVQALDDDSLAGLGRIHNARQALNALNAAASTFPRFSLDMIYARPGQTEAEWRRELSRALDLAGDHISLYQLTIEPGTRFHHLAATGRLHLPDADLARALYDATQELCVSRGFPAYEVSNHARPGAESRHNLLYWRYGEYAGVGAGAHGRVVTAGTRHATVAERTPKKWLERVERVGCGLVVQQALPQPEQAEEFLMMGLRLAEGIDINRLRQFGGFSLDGGVVRELVNLKLLTLDDARLTVTAEGIPVLNAVTGKLLAARPLP
ncbi:MAG: radical SAM family heme chaperone HemW, partial [Methylobacteriaceae bacterium]|nr:radical SAM family heme chaperone HemW [Methylobacteriaceae bacterium]